MSIARIITIAVIFAFTAPLLTPVSPAAAQSRQQVAKPQKKTVKRAVRGGQRQIACTEFGCNPIPRNCRPQTGYRWDGMPSGYDVVVCR